MDHYFTNNNIKSNMQKIVVTFNDKKYIFNTDNGVFSKDKLDYGTRLLLESFLNEEVTGKVLDVGCGYGPVGIIVASETKAGVDMVDVNLRALHLAKLNASQNKVQVNIYESDTYDNVSGKYDCIITNPPIRAGKDVVYKIIMDAKLFLSDNGSLWFVMRKDHGVKSLLKIMENDYVLSTVVKEKGFFVIKATKICK